MNIDKETQVRDAIKFSVEFNPQTDSNRIVEFLKDKLDLQE